MGVMLQAFYWDCPREEAREHQWWVEVRRRIPSLQQAGFTALWLPPVGKGAWWKSMGYDPYDYYDLGEFDQKGGVPTWFGTRAELGALIQTAHDHGLQVYVDAVFNHNSGADREETNALDGKKYWTRFMPRSTRFARDGSCFHPSRYEQWDDGAFGGMPDLCHRNPRVYTQLLLHARWLLEEVGFDGFRYDMVKGYGGWMVRAIQELRALRNGRTFKPYGVGECWDSSRTIEDWLNAANAWSDNPVGAFDFPLRYRLRDLCDRYGFSLRELVQPGVLLWERPREAVTFVENHDVVRNDPIVNEKLLAYAFILTHEGYPCVFWQDYFNWGLAQEGKRSGIAALVEVHERHAGGPTRVLHVEDDLYVMQREGTGPQGGLIFVLNNRSTWNGTGVRTKWTGRRFVAAAWWGRDDTGVPGEQWSDTGGWGEFWAPPRGYAVYTPQ